MDGSSGKSGKALQVHAIRLKTLLVAPFSESSAGPCRTNAEHLYRQLLPTPSNGYFRQPPRQVPWPATRFLTSVAGESSQPMPTTPNRHDDPILPGFPVLPEEPKIRGALIPLGLINTRTKTFVSKTTVI